MLRYTFLMQFLFPSHSLLIVMVELFFIYFYFLLFKFCLPSYALANNIYEFFFSFFFSSNFILWSRFNARGGMLSLIMHL
jgi:uncharacterized membrane protein